LNPNYTIIVKQDIDKLLAIGFNKHVEEATWLSPIVIVPKKNGKLVICVDFRINYCHQEKSMPITFY
jgi:hypothetical protein